MSGIFWCCCAAGGPPPQCVCNCVCTQAFEIMDQDTGQYLGVWSDEQLITGNEWTIIYWTNECGAQTELGTGFHQYDNDDDDTTIRLLSYEKPGDPGTHVQEFAVKLWLSTGAVWVTLSATNVEFPSGNQRCKMRAFRFRQVNDPSSGNLVPETAVTIYTDSAPKYETKSILDEQFAPADVGYYPDVAQKTYLGAEFPFNTPKYNPNIPFFAGCISNPQTFNSYLSDAQLDQLWDNGNGLSPPIVITWPENIDQWCAADPHPFQESVGSNAGTVLQHEGVEWDQDGEGIQDENNEFVQGVN